MKTGIVTIYSAFNYGSFLQAYAMQKTLENMGNECDVLNCSRITAISSLRKKIFLKKLPFSLKRLSAYSKDWRKLAIKKYNGEKYDAVIVGSDEVWNIKGSFEHWPEYFGDGVNADKLIAYAPSIGFSTVQDFLEDKDTLSKIKNFDAVFPRDNATAELCNQASCNSFPRVVDPTLLCLDMWQSVIGKGRAVKEKYVLYYSYLDNSPMKPFIQRFAKENNLKVVIVGFDYKWGDINMMVSPLEFLQLVNDAEYVFTSTFHGTVFSTIFKKRFLTRPSGQKVNDYLSFLNLENRAFSDDMSYEQFCKTVRADIDYESVRNLQKKSSEESKSALMQAIK